jgi:hypothetical protein
LHLVGGFCSPPPVLEFSSNPLTSNGIHNLIFLFSVDNHLLNLTNPNDHTIPLEKNNK